MLKGKKIVLGVTGSIAAYKSVYLLRLLEKEGADVRVIMTPQAKNFISPLSFSTLSRNPVLTEMFEDNSWANHVMLGRWADLILIAPLTCNTLSKMAQGQCDNLLLAVYLSATCPVWVVPAMDEDMWRHPATKRNLKTLEEYGNKIIPVDTGSLASGLTGEGRMAEPEFLFKEISNFFFKGRLLGKKALVTAGPTHEPLDPVRFIGNRSTGKMGIALANALAAEGAEVTLVLGPVEGKIDNGTIAVKHIQTAAEMYEVSTAVFEEADMAIMSAAVADYSPELRESKKIKKADEVFELKLKKTPDILAALGQSKKPGQILIGFALETDNEKENAREKLVKKNADMIVLNSLKDPGAGFGYDTNKVTLFDKSGQEFNFELKSKNEVARDIVDTLIRIYYE